MSATSGKGKVLLIAGLVVAVMLAIASYLSFRYWERQVTEMIKEEAMVLARTIEAGLSVFMVEGSAKKVSSLLEFAAEAPDVAYVRIIGSDGTIAASSIPGEEDTAEPAFEERTSIGTSARVDVIRDDELGGSVRLFLPIMNREKCRSCHDPGLVTLGAVDMRLAMGEALGPMSSAHKYMFGFVTVGIAAVFGALYMVHRTGRKSRG